MDHTLIGVFDTQSAATQARQELLSAGFSQSDITVLPADDAAATATTTTTTTTSQHEGGVGGFFKSLFGMNDDDQEVGMYSEAVRRGGYMLSVHARNDAQMQLAEDVMQRYGTVDIDERATQWRQEGWTGGATTAAGTASLGATGTTTAADVSATGATTTVPVVQEELQVGKRAVRRGGLRVYTRLVETPVEETVNLREEHATIQRRPVDRPATEADLTAAAQSGTIEVRETAEQAVVSKTARVTEEIEVGKQVTERAETVRDTVRHTDVQVEQLDRERIAAAGGTTGSTSTTDATRIGSTNPGDKKPV